jgi:hypothetical protein
MEKFLKAACEAHGLTALTVTYIANNLEPFSSFPHRGEECGSGSGATVEDALVQGLKDLNRRFPTTALASRQTKEEARDEIHEMHVATFGGQSNV